MSLGSSTAAIIERATTPVRAMHETISGSTFDRIGPIAAPVRFAQDGVRGLVYASIVGIAGFVGPRLDGTLSPDSTTAHRMRSIVNSLWGDDLGEFEERLAIAMTASDARGRPIDDITDAPVTGRMVVLVHGLSHSDRCWQADTGLLAALAEEPGLTPITIRYNPGLPIAENGTQLAALLTQVADEWPGDLESIALVGYSMGGLVIVDALTEGKRAGASWVDLVGSVVAMGTPYGGSWIERAVGLSSRALAVSATTRPLSEFLESRSSGIRDLGHGHATADTAEGFGAGGVPVHSIRGTITEDPMHWIGSIIGDVVVHPTSAAPKDPHPDAETAIVGGTNHLDMLHDPRVTEQVVRWITSDTDPS